MNSHLHYERHSHDSQYSHRSHPENPTLLPPQPPRQSPRPHPKRHHHKNHLLCIKTFLYILNVIVIVVGCCCVFGSPAYKVRMNRQDAFHYLRTYNLWEFSTVSDQEQLLVFLQAVLFGVFGFFNLFVITFNLLIHCWLSGDYSTSRSKRLDPYLFLFCGGMMILTCFGIFFPVDLACRLTHHKDTWTSASYEERLHLCRIKWRVSDAIAAVVLGSITSFLYLMLGLFTACLRNSKRKNIQVQNVTVVQAEPNKSPNPTNHVYTLTFKDDNTQTEDESESSSEEEDHEPKRASHPLHHPIEYPEARSLCESYQPHPVVLIDYNAEC